MSDPDLHSPTATLEASPADIEKEAQQHRRRMTLNMGPQHPSTHGVLRVLLELDGETVTRAYPDIGFLHTGIEKQCETRTWQQVVPLTDRVDYLNNLGNNLVYALAVEKLLGVQEEMPQAVQMMRVLLAELQRINSHCVWLGTHALDIGAMTVFFYCFREREDILRIFEMFSGQRMMTSYIRPGGLALEPPRAWDKAVRKFIDAFPEKVDEYEELLDKNPIWLRRTKQVGFVPLNDLLDWGVTGPIIRAAGVPWDIRKDEPYSGYENYDFRVPTLTENDVWARYRVRMEEMRQSAKIVKQALEGMPDGPWQLNIPRVTLPDREKMKTQMEALIYHFKIVTEGMKVPAGEAYQAIESPRGEIAYYIVSDGSSHPHRVFMRTPSFGNLQSLPAMVEGKLIADTIASMGSMDFVLGDVDR
jgi:NADH-quinone oxidoreductase subunit D